MTRGILTGLLLAMVVSSASAQDRVFAGGRELAALGHFGADLGPAPDWGYLPRFGGNRFINVPGSGILDLRTGETLPTPDGVVLAYDLARPRVFVLSGGGVWAVDVRTHWSVLVLPGSGAGLTRCIHATSADILFCAFIQPDGSHLIVRSSGRSAPIAVTTVRLSTVASPSWVVTPDASRLYLAVCGQVTTAYCPSSNLAVVDVASGRIATTPLLDEYDRSSLVWDEARERVFVVSTRIAVYTSDLQPIGSTRPGGRCSALAISPHTGRIYLNVYDYYFSAQWAWLSAYDARTLQALEPPTERTSGSACVITLITAPGAPRDVRAIVDGRTVILTWTNIGAASSFVLDVGFAPGRTDLSVPLGPDPFASFANVPPGTYYVRLSGGNDTGGGRPSAEVAVTVR